MEGENADIRVGDRLRFVLKYRSQSLRSFSSVTGIPYRTLQDHIGNKSKPNADQLATIANHGINIDFLLTGNVRGFAFSSFNYGNDLLSMAVLGDETLVDVLEDLAIDCLFSYEFKPAKKDLMGMAYRRFLFILLQTAIDLFDVVLTLKSSGGGRKRIAEVVGMSARPALDRCYREMIVSAETA